MDSKSKSFWTCTFGQSSIWSHLLPSCLYKDFKIITPKASFAEKNALNGSKHIIAKLHADLSNQVPGSMGSRNGNGVRGTLLKLGFNTTGTRLFPCSRNGTNVPGTRNMAKFPVPGY
jgi:hypothetical protein